MENNSQIPQQRYDNSGYIFPPPTVPFPTGRRELIFGGLILLSTLFLCNSVFHGGLNLGYVIATTLILALSGVYLLLSGHKPTPYSVTLFILCFVATAAFGRSNDVFLKFILFFLVSVTANLALCLTAGKNMRAAGSISCLWDASDTLFRRGLGNLPEASAGCIQAFRNGGSAVRKSTGFLLGLCISAPILAVVIPLLTSADAAFDGVISLLPEFDLSELIVTVLIGVPLAFVFYTRGVALHHGPKKETTPTTAKKLGSVTVNTVLWAVSLVYCVYLFSQLAYLAGGFSGVLPENYTVAEYARRGFFEMAVLCAVNLTIIFLSLLLVQKESHPPLHTRLLCLFIGIVTLFLVCAASAKMFLYIGSYGLTYLRVVTQIFMVFLGLVTVLTAVWLFVPKLPYMKVALIAALVIASVTTWMDVDNIVARYNVDAYLSGQMESIDVDYLQTLSGNAVKHIIRLANEAPDAYVRSAAKALLFQLYQDAAYDRDFRSWNYADVSQYNYLNGYFDKKD